MKNSLFVRIYFSFIAVGLIVLLGTGGVGFFLLSKAKAGQNLKGTVEWILERLPDAKKNRSFFRRAFRQLAEQSQSKIGLWDERGRRLAVSERWTLRPHQECNDSIWIKPTQQEIGLCFALKDGRWFAIAFKREQYTEIRNQIFILFGLLFSLIWIGCYPLARSITRRLERLQKGVQALGQGALDRRVPVEGTDEVAQLAISFNKAAAQIQELMQSQRRFLASASHDLRAPLARIRMALELMQDDLPTAARKKIFSQTKTDISLLNSLIEDILLASKIQQIQHIDKQSVNLCELAKTEAKRFDATVELRVKEEMIFGEPRLLQRLLQNLLDNAKKYAGPEELTVIVDKNMLIVADRGPGIPPTLQERIFEPFFRPITQREKHEGGVGLGLSLVKDIARAHGATVTYEDRVGGGACFVIAFQPT